MSSQTMRVCDDCGRNLPRSSYTANQWSKGIGISRCASCIHGFHGDTPVAVQSDSGRYNQSQDATYEDTPFAEGGFRYVSRGTYTSGSRKGQACVVKWFKTGGVYEDDYFALDIKAVDRALDIVNKFNELNIVTKPIHFNVPAVWRCTNGRRENQRVLCEPFIANYEKFNSNSGWADQSDGWAEVMQALSHFSYHLSGGQLVLCDLQGGIYRRFVVLSDPVILSRRQDYGPTDLGPHGISSFFSQHQCNEYCRPNWSQPANPRQYFEPRMGTSMVRRTVPTRGSRPEHSYMPAWEEED